MSNILSPPIADPTLSQQVVGLTQQPAGRSLSDDLLFLEEILLQYERLFADWRSSPSNEAMMLGVRLKLTEAEATLTPPSFTSEEIMFIQVLLLEYERNSPDWRRTLRDFDMMQYVIGAVASGFVEEQPSPLGSDIGIATPPVADPFGL